MPRLSGANRAARNGVIASWAAPSKGCTQQVEFSGIVPFALQATNKGERQVMDVCGGCFKIVLRPSAEALSQGAVCMVFSSVASSPGTHPGDLACATLRRFGRFGLARSRCWHFKSPYLGATAAGSKFGDRNRRRIPLPGTCSQSGWSPTIRPSRSTTVRHLGFWQQTAVAVLSRKIGSACSWQAGHSEAAAG